ncbi:Hypothetical predicted protein, partial [Paramuricea clavata]
VKMNQGGVKHVSSNKRLFLIFVCLLIALCSFLFILKLEDNIPCIRCVMPSINAGNTHPSPVASDIVTYHNPKDTRSGECLKNYFEDILLIIVYHFPFYESIPLLKSFYQDAFKNIVICGSKNYSHHHIMVVDVGGGYFGYECVGEAIRRLGELIFGNNRKKEDELKTLRRRHDDIPLFPISESRLEPSLSMLSKDPLKSSSRRRDRNNPKTSTFVNSVLDESTIESLIDKMKSGMEIKDAKASEIMDVYEAKLTSLQTKESHLQDLLEAKTLALAQSDRMISQYRCRRAQSEAECTKLRHMLQETEKRCEAQNEQIHGFAESETASCQQIEKLKIQIKNLQMTAREHEQLKIASAEQTTRLETLKEALTAAQKEHESQSELNEMLRRHKDNLKNQHDCAIRQLHQLEEERKKIMQQLQQKDLKINEYSETLRAQAEDLQNKENEISQLGKSFTLTKAELDKKEQARKELAHKVGSLELVCGQREKVVKERELQLKDLQEHLDKYAQMSAMIHSLTGGTVPIVNNEEKPGTISKKK